MRWEYQPGSELFFVYTDERNSGDVGVRGLQNRALVLKLAPLMRF
jgi:hypothetical protein